MEANDEKNANISKILSKSHGFFFIIIHFHLESTGHSRSLLVAVPQRNAQRVVRAQPVFTTTVRVTDFIDAERVAQQHMPVPDVINEQPEVNLEQELA